MIKKFLGLVAVCLIMSCNSAVKKEAAEADMAKAKEGIETVTNNTMSVADLTIYDFDGLEPLLHQKDDKVHVINFWATWCAPCVKELPYFEQIHSELKDENVEVVLVSIDMPKMWETHLIPFIEKKKLESKVVILDDINENEWIPKVDENWDGAIPVTIIYKGNKRNFYPQPLTYEELRTEIDRFLKI